MPRHARTRPRADAQRNLAAILDAAIEVLRTRPNASVDEVARAAGLSRQTVYAHFASREALLDAVLARVTGEVLTELDAARLDEGPAGEALIRLIHASWRMLERYPFLLHAPSAASPEEDRARHAPILDRLFRLIHRGQAEGELDPDFSPGWLATATMALGHAAGEEVRAGRLSHEEASRMLEESLRRIYRLKRRTRRR